MTKKQSCNVCDKNTTNGFFILTGREWKYEYYCLSCARAFLGKFCKDSLSKANRTQLNHLSYQYSDMVALATKPMIKDGYNKDDIPFEYKNWLLKKKEQEIR